MRGWSNIILGGIEARREYFPHAHPEAQIGYVLEGEAEITIIEEEDKKRSCDIKRR